MFDKYLIIFYTAKFVLRHFFNLITSIAFRIESLIYSTNSSNRTTPIPRKLSTQRTTPTQTTPTISFLLSCLDIKKLMSKLFGNVLLNYGDFNAQSIPIHIIVYSSIPKIRPIIEMLMLFFYIIYLCINVYQSLRCLCYFSK